MLVAIAAQNSINCSHLLFIRKSLSHTKLSKLRAKGQASNQAKRAKLAKGLKKVDLKHCSDFLKTMNN